MDEQLMERLRKMNAKLQSLKTLGPNYEGEALLFAETIKRMLDKHGLEMSDIEFAAETKTDPVKLHKFDPEDFGLPGKKREILWEQALAITVAHAHKSEILFLSKSNSFYIVGRREHRMITEHMFVFLNRTVIRMADEAYT